MLMVVLLVGRASRSKPGRPVRLVWQRKSSVARRVIVTGPTNSFVAAVDQHLQVALGIVDQRLEAVGHRVLQGNTVPDQGLQGRLALPKAPQCAELVRP